MRRDARAQGPQSAFSAASGSRRVARNAGGALASTVVPMTTNAVATRVSGSVGDTFTSNDPRSGADNAPAASPTPRPAAASAALVPTTSHRMWRACAPIARRMSISR